MPDTMNAAVWTGIDTVEVMDRPIPSPDAGEALVRVESVGICGTDIAILTGKHPRAKAPLIMGHEAGGIIVDINGDAPEGIAVGSRVTFYPLISCGVCHTCRTGKTYVCEKLGLIGIDTDGAMAEYMTVPVKDLVAVPSGWDPAWAALTEPVAVAVHAVRRSATKVGDAVLVLGAGIIGNLCAQMAKAAGATTVAIADIVPSRLALAEKCGLTTIDLTSDDPVARTKGLTGGIGFDVVMECSGAAAAQPTAIACARNLGEILIVGMPKEPPPVDLRAVTFKELALTGTRVYEQQDFVRAIALVDQGKLALDNLITHRFPIEQAPEAFRVMKEAKDSLKILLTF